MAAILQEKLSLTDSTSIPWLNFGLYNIADGNDVEQATINALNTGYTGFDSATLYGNEHGVGRALKRADVSRENLFLTSKVWNGEQGYQETKDAVARSLERLQVEYLDLYLLHWPVPGKFKDSWRALEELYDAGVVRAIGVSNFSIAQLEDLLRDARHRPSINQVELHPHFAQTELHRFTQREGIQLAAWSPLKHGKALNDPVLRAIAARHDRSVAQVILRWLYQRGVVAVVKAATPAHIAQNAQIADFELSSEDISAIEALDRGDRIGPDPETVDYGGDGEFIRIFSGWEESSTRVA